MDIEKIVVYIHGLGGISCLIIAFVALRLGYKICHRKAGQNIEDATFEIFGLKVKVKSVGGFLMATSIVWGVLAWKIFPTYKSDGSGVVTISEWGSDHIAAKTDNFLKIFLFTEITYVFLALLDYLNMPLLQPYLNNPKKNHQEAISSQHHIHKNTICIPVNIEPLLLRGCLHYC